MQWDRQPDQMDKPPPIGPGHDHNSWSHGWLSVGPMAHALPYGIVYMFQGLKKTACGRMVAKRPGVGAYP